MGQKKCPKCGNVVPEEARFCGNCRRDMTDVKVSLPVSKLVPEGAGNPSIKPKENNTSSIVIGVVVVLLALFLINNVHVCAMCGKPFIGEAYYYASGSTGDRLDANCAEDYYGYLKGGFRA